MSAPVGKLDTAIPKKPFVTKKELLTCFVLSVTFGIFVCTVSNKLIRRDERRTESVTIERSILRGQPFPHEGRMLYLPPWQNRVMFPALLELGIHVGIFSPNTWYLVIRFGFSVMMFAAFWFALRTNAGADIKLAGAGLILLSYSLVLTFTSPNEMTFDLPEAMFAAIFISLSLQRKRWLLLIISIIAASNRESSAFAGVIWFFLYAIDDNKKINWKEASYGALVSICSYGCALALRFVFGGQKAVGKNTQFLTLRGTFYHIKNFILHPTPFGWPGLLICIFLPSLAWIGFNREYLTLTHKRLLLAALALSIISIIFGNISEPRTFITPIVLVVFVAVWLEASSSKSLQTQRVAAQA